MKPLVFSILTIVLSINSFCQQIDTVRISKIADNVILENISLDFLNYLLKNEKRITKCEWIPSSTEIDFKSINDAAYVKDYAEFNYMVNYDFTLPDGEMFRLKDDTVDCVFWGSPSFSISLDSTFNIVKTPNFKSLQKTFDKLQKAELINKDTAISISEIFFESQEQDIEAVLEYYLLDDLLYWRCTKTKSKKYRFRKIVVDLAFEHVLINAENGDYICNEKRNTGLNERTEVIMNN